jgi:site-specific recombinase XerD
MDLVPFTALPATAATRVEVVIGAWLASFSSSATRDAYRRDVRGFLAFLDGHGLDLLAVTRQVVDAFARTLEAEGKAPATVARRLSALASLFTYLVDEGLLASSPVERVKRPKVPNESTRLGLDRAEACALLDAAAASSPRDHALVALLVGNGLRISEALGLDVEDLATERSHRIARIVGKGNRSRTAPLAPRTIEAIEEYLGDRTSGPIFVTASGRRLDRVQAHRVFRRLVKAAGIDKVVSCHSARHGFVTLALESGAPLHRLADAAGHASPVTTQRYNRQRRRLDGYPAYLLAAHLASQPYAMLGSTNPPDSLGTGEIRASSPVRDETRKPE